MKNKNLKLKIIFFAILFFGLFDLAKSSHAWDKTIDFESGTVDQKCQGSGGLFDVTIGGLNNVVTNEEKHLGSKACKISLTQQDSALDNNKETFQFPSSVLDGQEIWVRGYFYFKSPWLWDSSSYVKVLGAETFHSNVTSAGHDSIIAIGSGIQAPVYSYSEPDSESSPLGPGGNLETDKWISLEMYIKLSNVRGTSRFIIWQDGTEVIVDSAYKSLSASSDYALKSLLMGEWNGGVPQNQVVYVDDFYWTTDTPSNRDEYDVPMIGPTDWIEVPDTNPPAAPAGLSVS